MRAAFGLEIHVFRTFFALSNRLNLTLLIVSLQIRDVALGYLALISRHSSLFFYGVDNKKRTMEVPAGQRYASDSSLFGSAVGGVSTALSKKLSSKRDALIEKATSRAQQRLTSVFQQNVLDEDQARERMDAMLGVASGLAVSGPALRQTVKGVNAAYKFATAPKPPGPPVKPTTASSPSEGVQLEDLNDSYVPFDESSLPSRGPGGAASSSMDAADTSAATSAATESGAAGATAGAESGAAGGEALAGGGGALAEGGEVALGATDAALGATEGVLASLSTVPILDVGAALAGVGIGLYELFTGGSKAPTKAPPVPKGPAFAPQTTTTSTGFRSQAVAPSVNSAVAYGARATGF